VPQSAERIGGVKINAMLGVLNVRKEKTCGGRENDGLATTTGGKHRRDAQAEQRVVEGKHSQKVNTSAHNLRNDL
jgi:hypothetical protein